MFRLDRHSLPYSLRQLYEVIGLREQSVSKHFKRIELKSQKIYLLIKQIDSYRKQHPGCGLEKLYYQINPDWIGRDCFIELAKYYGYQLKKKVNNIKTTIPGCYKWPNYIEGLLLFKINQVWQSDITYYKVGKTHYYLVFIIDVYSKIILGYSVSDSLKVKANLKALQMAIESRKENPLDGLIHHSDRGSQYIARDYIKMLLQNKCIPSMGLSGLENAYAERVNGIIKNEYLIYRKIDTYNHLMKWTQQAIRQYNHERIHDSLPGKISPMKFEEKLLNLDYQIRPKVMIYADGYKNIQQAKGLLNSLPEKALQDHICPIFM